MKTKKTDASVDAFIDAVSDPKRREDARKVISIMGKVTKQAPKMWGASLIGFGTYFYRYESGREGLFLMTGLSPRKGNLVVYLMTGFEDEPGLMAKLGKYKTGKSCLYIKNIEDVDLKVLTALIKRSFKAMKAKYPTGAAAEKAAAASTKKKATKKKATKKKATKKKATKKKARRS